MAQTLEFIVGINAMFSGGAQFGKFTQSMTQAQSKLQGLQQAAGKLQQLQRMNTSLEASKNKLAAAQAKVKALAAEMKRTPQPTQKMKAEFTRANIEAHKLSESVQRQRQQIGELKSSLEAAGVSTKGLAGDNDKLSAKIKEVTDEQRRLTEAQEKYNSIKSQLSWENIRGTVFGAFAAYKALQLPVKLSADFESAMARVKAVSFSGDNADMSKFDMLKAQALQLGADTKFTAIQAAQTQENLARGGFDPDQIKAALPAVLSMAAAEGMDLAQAGDIVVKTIGGMGLKAEDSGMVADLLANVSANSATNIAEVGEAMKIAAPVMSQLGVDIDQLGAYIGGMANKGFTGSEAGNALASSAMRLSKLPKDTYNALAALGVGVKTKGGQMREFPDIMKALKQVFDARNYGEAERMDYLARIFGTGQGKAMLGFMGAAVSGQIDALEVSNRTQKTGKAQRMADINLDTLNGQIELLGSAWDGLRTSIGDIFSPIVREGVELLAASLSKINTVINEFPVASKNVAFFFASLAGVKAASNLFRIGKALIQLPSAFLNAQGAGVSLIGAFKGVTSFGGVFKALWGIIAAHPFAIIITAAGLIYANWEDIVKLWHKAVAWWNNIDLKDVWQTVKDGFNDMINAIPQKWEELCEFISKTAAKLNPFNWTMPKWLGGGQTPQQTQQRHDRGQEALQSAFGAPNWEAHATGGILTRPHLGLVAEAGPEAVIPLRNKSRGKEVLMQAADMLGVPVSNIPNTVSNSNSIINAVSSIFGGRSSENTNTSSNIINAVSSIFGGRSSSASTNANSIMNAVSGIFGGNSSRTTSITELTENIRRNSYAGGNYGIDGGVYSRPNQDSSRLPQINITVNAGGSNDSQGLADMIKAKVMEAWQMIQEQNERLEYA